MNRSVLYFSGLCLILTISACSPRPVFRMTPRAEKTTFNQGTEYVHRRANNMSLTISYYQHMGDKFVMDVEIANYSDSVVRVDPTQFYYEAYKSISHHKSIKTGKTIAARQSHQPGNGTCTKGY